MYDNLECVSLSVPLAITTRGLDVAIDLIFAVFRRCIKVELIDTSVSFAEEPSCLASVLRGVQSASHLQREFPFLQELIFDMDMTRYRDEWKPSFNVLSRSIVAPQLKRFAIKKFPWRSLGSTSLIHQLYSNAVIHLHIHERVCYDTYAPRRRSQLVEASDPGRPICLAYAVQRWPNLRYLCMETATCTHDLLPLLFGLVQLETLVLRCTNAQHVSLLIDALSLPQRERGYLLPSLLTLVMWPLPTPRSVADMVASRHADASVVSLSTVVLTGCIGSEYAVSFRRCVEDSILCSCAIILDASPERFEGVRQGGRDEVRHETACLSDTLCNAHLV